MTKQSYDLYLWLVEWQCRTSSYKGFDHSKRHLIVQAAKKCGIIPALSIDLSNFPDTLTVYRGGTKQQAASGLSWTTDIDVAIHYASPYEDPTVVAGEVAKSNVDAFFIMADIPNSKFPNECIIDPTLIENLRYI
jgi:hypothetical protein